MEVTPYLHFNGNCEEALNFYIKAIGGKLVAKHTYGEAPPGQGHPKGMDNKLMHASAQIGERLVMGCDVPPDQYSKPQGLSLTLGISDVNEGKRIFDALAENGNVQMPFGKTFWAEGFGMVTDRFGIPWMINCEASKG